MTSTITDIDGTPALLCAPDGPPLGTPQDAVDLIGDAAGLGAELVVIPTSRLADGFLTLRTRIAGEFTDKFVGYRVPLVIVGDISADLAASDTLAAYVRESNRAGHVRYVPDLAALNRST